MQRVSTPPGHPYLLPSFSSLSSGEEKLAVASSCKRSRLSIRAEQPFPRHGCTHRARRTRDKMQ